MRKYGVIAGVCAGLMLMATTASAQNAAKVGLTMSSGSTIGVLVPVGTKAALRPTLGFARNTAEYEGIQFVEENISTTQWMPGLSALFYVTSWDDTRLYISPQYSMARISASTDLDEPRTSHALAFMVGGQHGLGSRFGVFAEAGLGWSRSKNLQSGGSTPSSITSTSWHTRATVGGMLFF